VIEPTCSQRDAASLLFNLSGYRVVEAVDGPLGIRKVVVESLDREGGCPSCGVLTARCTTGGCSGSGTYRSAGLLRCGFASVPSPVPIRVVGEEHSPSTPDRSRPGPDAPHG
jgi:hypothetical protein